MAAIHLVTSRHRDDPDAVLAAAADDDLLMVLHDGAAPSTRAFEVLGALADGAPQADAVFGDAVEAGRHLRRAGWSPTRAITDPASLYPLAIRARTLRARALRPGDPLAPAVLAAAGATVLQVPTVLSHHSGSPPVPSAEEMSTHLRGLARPTAVEAGPRAGTFRLRRTSARPTVSVVIPTAGARGEGAEERLVSRCLSGIAPILSPGDELIIVVGDEFDGDPASIAAPSSAAESRVVVRPPGGFNFSQAVNHGVLAADGELVLLLNDDVDDPDPDFLDSMSAHLDDPSVGAVGALLRYRDGRVQHAGIVIDDARPLHSFVGRRPSELAHDGADVARDVIAVTGACMLLRRRDFLAVGGLSVEFPRSFNDVDLCLRLRRVGRRVVMEPGARLVHHEGGSRAPRIEKWEWDRWIGRWGAVDDPWYHPGHFRPDDPGHLNRNADHLDPATPFESTVGRDTAIRPRVHHARLA